MLPLTQKHFRHWGYGLEQEREIFALRLLPLSLKRERISNQEHKMVSDIMISIQQNQAALLKSQADLKVSKLTSYCCCNCFHLKKKMGKLKPREVKQIIQFIHIWLNLFQNLCLLPFKTLLFSICSVLMAGIIHRRFSMWRKIIGCDEHKKSKKTFQAMWLCI